MAAGALWRRPESGIQTSAGAIPIEEINVQHSVYEDDWKRPLPSGLHPSIESGYGVAPEDVRAALIGKAAHVDPKFKSKPVMGGWGDKDEDFWESLKEQLAESGQNYDKADQPFMALSPARIGNARIQPAEMRSMVPSIANIRGTPTGVSYNPYIAQKKRTA